MLTEIKKEIERYKPLLQEIYRYLHMYPELSGQEYKTAAYIARHLTDFDINVTEYVGKVGLLAEISVNEGDYIALRADMDALPILENSGLPYSSRNRGIMHACGHDVHSSIVLGTAIVLSKLRKHLCRNIRFIFQSAEETAEGAKWMIRDGALNNVSNILSLHSFPSIPAGKIGIKYGTFTAALDYIEISILDASENSLNSSKVDIVLVSTQVINALQYEVSKQQNLKYASVCTVGKIRTYPSSGQMAEKVTMSGTVRTLDLESYADLPSRIEAVVQSVCTQYGATYELSYVRRTPVLDNDDLINQLIEKASCEAIGKENVVMLNEPSLGSEDFALYLNQVSGAMFRLGVGHSNDEKNYPLHNSKFSASEKAIETGILVLSNALLLG